MDPEVYDPASIPRAAPRAAPRGVFAEAGTPTSPPPLPSTLPPGMVINEQLSVIHLFFIVLYAIPLFVPLTVLFIVAHQE